MYRVEICYPNLTEEGKFFDTDYYLNKHMPWAKGLLGGDEVVKSTAVEVGIPMGKEPAEYACKGILCVEDLNAFFGFMAKAGMEFQNDLPHFTNMLPPRVSVYQIL